MLSPFHPVILMLDSIRKTGRHRGRDLFLIPSRSTGDVNQLNADASLRCERVPQKPLARLRAQKDCGNPFL